MMIIQIYEVQTATEARRMIELGVDHIGSVIQASRHWQDDTLKAAIETVQAAGGRSSLIPLFDDSDLIAQVIEYYRPDILHFCEAIDVENPDDSNLARVIDRQKRIRRRFGQLMIMRSIPIAVNGQAHRIPSLELASIFEPFSDWLLTDTLLLDREDMEQPVSGYVGITGQTCDWEVARRLVAASSIPVILAGGIGPENVREGIAAVNPAGVDSCTRTNAMNAAGLPIRFRKDYNKVQKMVEAARGK
jgi:phosphoribosylanthranilate isomerase